MRVGRYGWCWRAVGLAGATTTVACGGPPAERQQASTVATPRGDTDGDGLSDAAEARRYHTDPRKRDTDGDRVNDGAEVKRYHINPRKADTDGDGVQDGDEVKRYHSDPRKRDTDGDRLRDGDEVDRYKTDPRKADTDGDGLRDRDQVVKYKTNPLKADTDGDGLRDRDEVVKYKTNPLKADTDGDSFGDRVELRGGTILNARSHLGYPDASNTGVPAGTTLTPTPGFTAGTNNAVYSGLDISGTVRVTASNVTIKNSRISHVDFFGIDMEPGGSATIEDVEIDCGRAGTKGIVDENFTAIRVNIHNCEDGAFIGEHATIKDSYIHDLATSPDAHNDGIQAMDAINVTIEHNRIYGVDTSAIFLNANTGGPLARNTIVKDNLLAGGGWTQTVQLMRLPTSKFWITLSAQSSSLRSAGTARVATAPTTRSCRETCTTRQGHPSPWGVIPRGRLGENRPNSCHDLPGERPMTSTEPSAVIIVSHNSAGRLTPCLCLHAASGNLVWISSSWTAVPLTRQSNSSSASFPTFELTTENRIRGRERR